MAFEGSTNTDIMSDETFDLRCRVCNRKGKNQEAEKYCVECQDYFCLTCVKVHEDIPALTGHKILDKDQDQFSSGSSKTLSKGPQESSQGQPAAPTDRQCKDIFYIPEFIQNNASQSIHRNVKDKLESMANSLTEHHESLQHEKQQLLKDKDVLLQKIRGLREEINERLDELEKSSVADIDDRFKTLISKIDEGIIMLDANRANVKSAQDKIGSPGSTISQDFVNAMKGKNIASCASRCLEHNIACIQTADIGFSPDQRILALLREINMLGKTTQINTCIKTTATSNVHFKMERNQASSDGGNPQVSDDLLQVRGVGNNEIRSAGNGQETYNLLQAKGSDKPEETSTLFQAVGVGNAQGKDDLLQVRGAGKAQGKDDLLQARGGKQQCVKVKSDRCDCNIVSACFLDDGTVILSDYNNNKLKRLDSSTYTVTDYCDLHGEPWQVCPISKQEVAVCLTGKQVVQFISVGSRLKKSNKKIKTNFDCFGLAYAVGNLYISDLNTSVYIYSVSGSKLKEFSEDQTEQNLYYSIKSLAVSKDGSKIYVSKFYDGVTVLDNDGQVVGQYKGQQLNGTFGCYLTDIESLLVCGYFSKNVLQFGKDGELIGKVLQFKENVSYQAICCHQQLSKMILGRLNNEIEVYDLIQ